MLEMILKSGDIPLVFSPTKDGFEITPTLLTTAVSDLSLSQDGTILAIGSLDVGIFVLTKTGSVWGSVKLPLPASGPYAMGYSVALSADGNTLISGTNNQGRVYIYTNNSGVWSLDFEHTSLAYPGDRVSVNDTGTICAAGGYTTGTLTIYTKTSGNWSSAQLPEISQATGWYPFKSVSLSSSGETCVVCGGFSKIGVYTLASNVWSYTSIDTLLGLSLRFERVSVNATGDMFVAGLGTTTNMYVFTKTSGTWSYVEVVFPVVANGYLGYSVSMNDVGDMFAVSAITSGMGQVFVATNKTGVWSVVELKNPGVNYFGHPITLAGNGKSCCVGVYETKKIYFFN